MAMMAITTRSSINVKPCRRDLRAETIPVLLCERFECPSLTSVTDPAKHSQHSRSLLTTDESGIKLRSLSGSLTGSRLPSFDTKAPGHVDEEACRHYEVFDSGPFIGAVCISGKTGQLRIAQDTSIGRRSQVAGEVRVGKTHSGAGQEGNRLTQHSLRRLTEQGEERLVG